MPESVSDVNPYVGPLPFEKGQPLFGRDREAHELRYLLTSERIVLLYSPSGAGKSSLVNAGLIPALENRFEIWGPTRVKSEPPPGAGNRYVWSAIAGMDQTAQVDPGVTWESYLKGRSSTKNPLIILDQFEEILNLDPTDAEVKFAFFEQFGRVLQDPHIWALIVLREDYLAPLDAYARLIPTHLQNRFRLDLLSREAAYDAIARPVLGKGREFAPKAVEQLITDLGTMNVQQVDGTFVQKTGPHVEPLQLQVVCRGLWERAARQNKAIDLEDVTRFGNVTNSLADYYTQQVKSISGTSRRTESAIRRWVGSKLITRDGLRWQVLKRAGSSDGLDNRLIERLVDSHLVRAEHHAGAIWFELAHDRLVQPVRKSNREWSRALRTRRLLQGSAALLGCLVAALLVLLAVSYRNNQQFGQELIRISRALPNGVSSEPNGPKLDDLKQLDQLRGLYETLARFEKDGAPLTHRFFQGDLYQRAQQTYSDRLTKLLLLHVIDAMIAELGALPNSPDSSSEYSKVYLTLKSYLMTAVLPERRQSGDCSFLQTELSSRWMAGRNLSMEQIALANRQFRTFSCDSKLKVDYRQDLPLVEKTRAFLAQFSGVDRIYIAIKSSMSIKGSSFDFNATQPRSSSPLAIRFTVPFAFTNDGFPQFASAIRKPQPFLNSGDWVLHSPATAANIDIDSLVQQMQQLSERDFRVAWATYLRSGKVIAFVNLKDAVDRLAMLTGSGNRAQSVLFQFLAAVPLTPREAPVELFQPVRQALYNPDAPYWKALDNVFHALVAAAESGNLDAVKKQEIAAAVDAAKVEARKLSSAFIPDRETQIDVLTQELLLAPLAEVNRLLQRR